jgi:hypothetical protein
MTGHLACVVGKRAVAPGAHSISWADEAEFAGHPVAVDVPVPGDIFVQKSQHVRVKGTGRSAASAAIVQMHALRRLLYTSAGGTVATGL